MSAGLQFQAEVVAALREMPQLYGVFDGPPARAAFPYAVIDCGEEKPWNSLTSCGREITVKLTLWDDQPARLADLEDEAAQRIEAISDVPAYQVAKLVLRGRRTSRDPDRPWSTAFHYEAKLLRMDSQ